MRRESILTWIGAVAAVVVSACLIVGIEGLLLGQVIVRNWLAVLLGIDAGLGVSLGSLKSIAAIDIIVLALSAVAFAALWPGPGRPHRVWMGLVVGLPLAGIGVLVATGLLGRSGLMSGGLIVSSLLLPDRRTRALGVTGLLAHALLLTGDFATLGGRAPLVATAVGAGYLCLVVWFIGLAAELFARAIPLPAPASHT